MSIENLKLSSRQILETLANHESASDAIAEARWIATRLAKGDVTRARAALATMLRNLALSSIAEQGSMILEWNGPSEVFKRQEAALRNVIQALAR